MRQAELRLQFFSISSLSFFVFLLRCTSPFIMCAAVRVGERASVAGVRVSQKLWSNYLLARIRSGTSVRACRMCYSYLYGSRDGKRRCLEEEGFGAGLCSSL